MIPRHIQESKETRWILGKDLAWTECVCNEVLWRTMHLFMNIPECVPGRIGPQMIGMGTVKGGEGVEMAKMVRNGNIEESFLDGDWLDRQRWSTALTGNLLKNRPSVVSK